MQDNLYDKNIQARIFKIDVFTKIFSFIAFIIFAFLNKILFFVILYLIVFLLLLKFSGVKVKELIKKVLSLWYLDLLFIIPLLLTFSLSKFTLIILNIQIIFIYLYFIQTSTSPIELRKFFIKLFKPLKKLKINNFFLADLVVNILLFIPELNDNVKKTTKAEKSRGVDIFSVNLRTKLVALYHIYITGIKKTQKFFDKKENMKKFMLYDKKKELSLKNKKLDFIDFLFLIVNTLFFLLLYYGEDYYYEILNKLFL